MDVVEKLTKYIAFNEMTLVDYGDTIENKFKPIVEKLDEGRLDNLTS